MSSQGLRNVRTTAGQGPASVRARCDACGGVCFHSTDGLGRSLEICSECGGVVDQQARAYRLERDAFRRVALRAELSVKTVKQRLGIPLTSSDEGG